MLWKIINTQTYLLRPIIYSPKFWRQTDLKLQSEAQNKIFLTEMIKWNKQMGEIDTMMFLNK